MSGFLKAFLALLPDALRRLWPLSKWQTIETKPGPGTTSKVREMVVCEPQKGIPSAIGSLRSLGFVAELKQNVPASDEEALKEVRDAAVEYAKQNPLPPA